MSGTGTLVDHPKGPKVTSRDLVYETASKRHPPKIMVLAVVCRPSMLNFDAAGPNTPAVFDESRDGKIALMRCAVKQEYKRTVYDKKKNKDGSM